VSVAHCISAELWLFWVGMLYLLLSRGLWLFRVGMVMSNSSMCCICCVLAKQGADVLQLLVALSCLLSEWLYAGLVGHRKLFTMTCTGVHFVLLLSCSVGCVNVFVSVMSCAQTAQDSKGICCYHMDVCDTPN